jgi:hypothetical protein
MAEIRNLIAEFAIGLQELNKNKILCGRGIWDETKSFLQNKAGISAIKERKNSCELDFSISNKTTAAVAELRFLARNRYCNLHS